MKPDPHSFLPLRPVEFHVLLALADEERHGYAIMQETAQRTGGALRLDPGTLYRALGRMARAGLVASNVVGGGRRLRGVPIKRPRVWCQCDPHQPAR